MDEYFEKMIEQIENDDDLTRDQQGRILIDIRFDASWQLSRNKRNSPHGHQLTYANVGGVPKIISCATKHKGIQLFITIVHIREISFKHCAKHFCVLLQCHMHMNLKNN